MLRARYVGRTLALSARVWTSAAFAQQARGPGRAAAAARPPPAARPPLSSRKSGANRRTRRARRCQPALHAVWSSQRSYRGETVRTDSRGDPRGQHEGNRFVDRTGDLTRRVTLRDSALCRPTGLARLR